MRSRFSALFYVAASWKAQITTVDGVDRHQYIPMGRCVKGSVGLSWTSSVRTSVRPCRTGSGWEAQRGPRSTSTAGPGEPVTTVYKYEVLCSLCGAASNHSGLMSTSSFGSPDLDTRPPPLRRSTMYSWVQRCPACGHCARDLSEDAEESRVIVESLAYRAVLGDEDLPELAVSFLCLSMLDEGSGDGAAATWALLHGAWACDDAELAERAVDCRNRAIAMYRGLSSEGGVLAEQAGVGKAVVVDLLRRAGRLEEAAAELAEGVGDGVDEIIEQVLSFQGALVQARDLECHRIEEALRR